MHKQENNTNSGEVSRFREDSLRPYVMTGGLTLGELETARKSGADQLERLLNEFRRALTKHRASHGVSQNLKTKAANIFHEHHIGDPSQLIMDTADPKSCRSFVKHLFKTGATEVWMGTAHDDDGTDIHGDKNAETPMIKGIRSINDFESILALLWGKIELDKLSPELLKANLNKKGEQNLNKVAGFMPRYYARKIAKRYALSGLKIDELQWDNLLEKERQYYLNWFMKDAYEIVMDILTGKNSWEKVNASLVEMGQREINPVDHPLHKIFRQDVGEWQIADIMSTPNSIVIEIPHHQFTHREGTNGNGLGKSRIEFTYEDNKPIIICNPEDLPWIQYIINSKKFLRILEKECIPKLSSQSEYAQIEIMFDHKARRIVFAADGIVGHIDNERSKTVTHHPHPLSLLKFTEQINSCTVRSWDAHEKIAQLDLYLSMISDLESGIANPSIIALIPMIQELGVMKHVDAALLYLSVQGLSRRHQKHQREVKFASSQAPVETTHIAQRLSTPSEILGTLVQSLRPNQKDLSILISMISAVKNNDKLYPQLAKK